MLMDRDMGSSSGMLLVALAGSTTLARPPAAGVIALRSLSAGRRKGKSTRLTWFVGR